MGLLRYLLAIFVWSVVPFDARGGVRDLDNEAASRIAKRFIALAGSEENAVALALSLRTGGLVMLVHDAGDTSMPATTVFELPTRAMDWDDVRICLALVEDSLVRGGVRQPSPQQLETTLLHVLDTLSDGVEWKVERVRARGKGG